MRGPLISIAIATRNREEFLTDLLKSLCHQSFKNFEVIIVDDNNGSRSGKGVKRIIEKYSDELRIKLLCNLCNIGLPISLNRGVSIARGK